MWSVHPFRKHFCVLFLSLAIIGSYVKVKQSLSGHEDDTSDRNGTSEWQNSTLSDDYGEDYNDNSLEDLINYLELNLSDTTHVGLYFNFSTTKNAFNSSEFVSRQARDVVYLLGLFELTTKWGKRTEGISEMLSAQLAVEHINRQNVLPGYMLQLLVNDTQCDTGIGIDRFFHALYSNKTITMLLGSSCSNVTESLAHVVPYWNIMQVSFGSTSPSLSDRNKFPLFFRTVAPDSSHNLAKISFLGHFGWKIVAGLIQSGDAYLLPLNRLVKELEQENISCVSAITFSLENYKEQLRTLKNLDIRVILSSFSEAVAPRVFCEVHRLGMFGTDYVWILQDQQESRQGRLLWWMAAHGGCNGNRLSEAVEGLILVSDYDKVTLNESPISGLTNAMFERQLNVSRRERSRYVRQTYDAVWAMALALRESRALRLAGPPGLAAFHYGRKDMACDFVRTMAGLRFTGLSGPVTFNGADRMGNSILRQVQGGRLVDVAIFLSDKRVLDFNCATCWPIRWKDNQIPIAQRKLKLLPIKIPLAVAYCVLSLSAMGIVVCLVFLYFNLRYGRVKTVKLSSPKLNNVAVAGCISVYLSVILLSIDMATLDIQPFYTNLCTVRIYLLSAGFSLAFGSMFAKTYRVHRLFTYFGPTIVRDRLLKDEQLIVLILVPLLIDAVMLTLWVMLDPMQQRLHNLTLEISSTDRGVLHQPQIKVCRSQNTAGWFIALYGYKGLLLIMGVYMAWQTRHVKVPALNDSHYIGVCVYGAVFSAIVTVFSSLASEFVVVSYLATTVSILASTTVTLLLLFIPKLKSVFGQADGQDLVTQSMGLKTEFNTRRLMRHDQKELIYRLEVQNRVYRCELENLDREIARLEDLLSSPRASSSHHKHGSGGVYAISHADQSSFLGLFTPSSCSRASWPSERGMVGTSLSRYSSDNKLAIDQSSKLGIFSRLKKIFGSIPSVVQTADSSRRESFSQGDSCVEKPNSNPDVRGPTPAVHWQIRSKSDVAVGQ